MLRTSLAVAILTTALVAQTNLIQNGSFEAGPSIPSTQTQITISPTTVEQIPNWTVPFGNVDYLSQFWTPSDGIRAVDLNGITTGAIEQTVATSAGAQYQIFFDMGSTGSPNKLMNITAAGQTSQTFVAPAGPFPAVTYIHDLSWIFTANSTSTTIRFTSLIGAATGAHIDNVRMFLVTPPPTFAAYIKFGQGCRGARMDNGTTLPILGQNLVLTATGFDAGVGFGMLLTGYSYQQWGPVTLPLELAGRCTLLVSGEGITPFLLVNRTGSVSIPIPNDNNLLGMEIFNQAIGITGATRFTNAGKGIVGNQ